MCGMLQNSILRLGLRVKISTDVEQGRLLVGCLGFDLVEQ